MHCASYFCLVSSSASKNIFPTPEAKISKTLMTVSRGRVIVSQSAMTIVNGLLTADY